MYDDFAANNEYTPLQLQFFLINFAENLIILRPEVHQVCETKSGYEHETSVFCVK